MNTTLSIPSLKGYNLWMKSILLGLFLAIAAIGCDTPENSTGTDVDLSAPPPSTTDTMMTSPITTDTVITTPVDTTGSMPSMPMDTTIGR